MVRYWIAIMVFAVAGSSPADDWHQWRGPQRNGVVSAGPALLKQWPDAGPPLVWHSEATIPSGDKGGYGSVVVAAGRAYVYAAPRLDQPLETRTLSEPLLRRLGWQPDMPAETILVPLEAARLSPERASLTNHVAVLDWIQAWMDEQLDPTQRLAHGAFVRDRLRQGTNATALVFLHKLELLISREFSSTNALNAWLDESNLSGEQRKKALSVFPISHEVGRDTIYCLDAMTGTNLWVADFPGAPHAHGASSTPCVVDGRCYVIGSSGVAYCLDALTGDLVWQEKLASTEKHSSFVVADGVAVIPAERLTALDAATGDVLWQSGQIGRTHSSPVTWRHGGKSFVICSANDVTRCFNLLKGGMVWEIPDGGDATPAIVGDHMLIWDDDGLTLYQLGDAGATRRWTVASPADYGSSPCLYGDYAYAMGGRLNMCVELESGRIAWQERVGTSDYTSPVIADGKIFAQAKRRELVMLGATPTAGRILARASLDLAGATSAAIVDGRIYIRTRTGVACHDLRRQTATGEEPDS